MHIVHLTHRAWPVVGGSERHVQEIARRQTADGHSVTVMATDAVDLSALWSRHGRRVDPETPDRHQGVCIRRLATRCLPCGGFAFALLRRAAWMASVVSSGAALPLARFSPWTPGLEIALHGEAADLLVAWNITLEGLTAAAAREAGRRGVPWIAVPLLHLGRDRFYTMSHQLNLLRSAQAVLAQTPSNREFLLQRGFAADRVHVAGPGVNLDEGNQADGQRFRRKHGITGPMILSLGALSRDKGTPHVLEAADRLWQQGRTLTVVLLGPLQESMRRITAHLPRRDRVPIRYLGVVSEQEKWDALDAADVVVLTSRTESFGIVFLEAWARAKPVIGARAGGVPDVISEGEDGLLVEYGDVTALAEALARLLDHPRSAAEMGRHGRAKAHRMYTWEQQYARWQAVVGQVTDTASRGEA